MLFTIAIVLFILWALGFFVVHVGGGLIHALLVIALIIIVYRLLTGQRVAKRSSPVVDTEDVVLSHDVFGVYG